MGDLGLVRLGEILLGLAAAVSVASGYPIERMLQNRKEGAKGFKRLLDNRALLEPERYNETGLRYRRVALLMGTASIVIGLLGLYLLVIA